MYDKQITTLLEQLLTHLQLPFSEIIVEDVADVTRVQIESEIPSKIIGWHGETLNSIQHMLKSMIRTTEKLERAPFIVCDVDGYRRSQEEKVCAIATKKADFVRRTGSRVALPPMSPYFRRIVHLYIADNTDLQDLTTESVGKGDYRQIVLRLKDESASKNASDDEGELNPVIEEDTTDMSDLENLDI